MKKIILTGIAFTVFSGSSLMAGWAQGRCENFFKKEIKHHQKNLSQQLDVPPIARVIKCQISAAESAMRRCKTEPLASLMRDYDYLKGLCHHPQVHGDF